MGQFVQDQEDACQIELVNYIKIFWYFFQPSLLQLCWMYGTFGPHIRVKLLNLKSSKVSV